MRRQSHEEVAEAARRRLELLGRELEQAGLRRVDDDLPWAPEEPPLPEPSRVPPPGRHARPSALGRARGWLVEQVPATLRGRTRLEPGPVLLVVALVAVALVVTAVVVLRSGSGSEAIPAAAHPAPALRLSPAPSTSASPTATGSVTVDVSGRVRRPGIAVLPVGSRVVDAIRRAGGARGGVDLTGLNLARVLVDGEQILVGRSVPAAPVASGAVDSAAPGDGALVDLNTATAEQLDTLPGVGPVTAQKILEWRSAHGSFSSVDQLLEVAGIGEKTLADIAPHATV